MLAINELRIGNYVLLNGAVTKLTLELLLQIAAGANADPVSLSPSLFTNNGFVQVDDQTFRQGFLFVYRQNDAYNCRIKRPNSILPTSYYYLHEFQNMYYAVMGEEWDINL